MEDLRTATQYLVIADDSSMWMHGALKAKTGLTTEPALLP